MADLGAVLFGKLLSRVRLYENRTRPAGHLPLGRVLAMRRRMENQCRPPHRSMQICSMYDRISPCGSELHKVSLDVAFGTDPGRRGLSSTKPSGSDPNSDGAPASRPRSAPLVRAELHHAVNDGVYGKRAYIFGRRLHLARRGGPASPLRGRSSRSERRPRDR